MRVGKVGEKESVRGQEMKLRPVSYWNCTAWREFDFSGLSVERIMGKWSLSHRSEWVARDKEGTSEREQKMRSIEERQPEMELR